MIFLFLITPYLVFFLPQLKITMPAIPLNDLKLTSMSNEKKEKKDKRKNMMKDITLTETLGSDSLIGDEKSKKESKRKKRKVSDVDFDEERSGTRTELVEPVNSVVNGIEVNKSNKKRKKGKVVDEDFWIVEDCSCFKSLDANIWSLNVIFNTQYIIFVGKVKDVSKVLILLFSATLPVWVKQVGS